MESKRRNMDDRAGQFLSRIAASRVLPSLPQVLLKLLEACRNEETTIKEIAQIINSDSALCGRILGIVNSPFYRRAEKIVRVDNALFQLGRDAVRSIAVSASIHQVFSRVNGQSPFNMKLYWHHALLCAVLARRLSEKTAFKAPELSFLSGILHDVGRVVLWVHFPEEYGKVLADAGNRSELLLEGEARMGITHAEVGAWLLSRWGLDAFTIDAARYHHEPLERIHGAFPLIKIVYAANLLADMPDSDLSRSKVVRELFGLGFTDITDMLSAAREEVRELAESLGIQVAPVELPQQPREGKDGEQGDVLAGEVRDVALLQTALQGLMDAVDRDAINEVVYSGLTTPRQAAPVSASPFFDKEFAEKWVKFNKKKANALLDEIGLTKKDGKFRLGPDGKRLSLTLEAVQDDLPPQTLELLRKNWEAIGIEILIRIEQEDMATQKFKNGDFDLFYTYADRMLQVSADPTLALGHESYAENYYKWWNTKGADGVEPPKDHPIRKIWADWEAAAGAPTLDEAHKHVQDMITDLKDQVYMIGLVGEGTAPVIVNAKLGNFPKGFTNEEVLRNEGNFQPAQLYFKK